ncbi:MAG: nucleotidyl transferase AbiEii/AbiGii toxin family protein [Firmicutes bacterium]|nr:nucleotidyl transferase AbiEii/AbiGii toxin family protein [Bacillota bacterium]
MASLKSNNLTSRFYIAGGTAAALQLGHRLSYDFDFFSREEFDPVTLIQRLASLGSFSLTGEAWCTVHGILDGVRVSFMTYKYPLLFPVKRFKGIDIADLRDIALMKITAISSRGSKKDFIDLYVICKEVIPVNELLKLLEDKYKGTGYSLYHIIRSLAFFDDAERDVDPITLTRITWTEVKEYFTRLQKELLASY